MPKSNSKVIPKDQTNQPKDNQKLKDQFIDYILEVDKKKISIKTKINFLINLEGTRKDGLLISRVMSMKAQSEKSPGGFGKGESYKSITNFAREEFLKIRAAYPDRPSTWFADILIKKHGSKKVGAAGPLRRKIAMWKKEK